MTHRPTPRRFTGTPPTRALRLGDLELLGGEAVGGNLLQVPRDPLEPPHLLIIPRSHRAGQL